LDTGGGVCRDKQSTHDHTGHDCYNVVGDSVRAVVIIDNYRAIRSELVNRLETVVRVIELDTVNIGNAVYFDYWPLHETHYTVAGEKSHGGL
jgi:alkyl hydroperoxide reductase subunit AhpC